MPPAAKVESRVALAELRDAASRQWISNAFSKTAAFERFFMRFQCFLNGVSKCLFRVVLFGVQQLVEDLEILNNCVCFVDLGRRFQMSLEHCNGN